MSAKFRTRTLNRLYCKKCCVPKFILSGGIDADNEALRLRCEIEFKSYPEIFSESTMDELRARAYRVLLSQGLLHLKWDLARFYCGLTFTRPWALLRESRAIRTAALRAFAFHNLAISAGRDFAGFAEDAFWADIDKFHRDCPNALCRYREVFEQCLRGLPVSIIAPDGLARQSGPGAACDRQ
ncbi:MAG: hypothetical protein JSS02_35290 [Planctomycetes bacterium]|nr:hypothetical protein [Planctomycetota bacterium]